MASCEQGTFAVIADLNGQSTIYASNETDCDIILEKNTRMGSVELITSFSPLNRRFLYNEGHCDSIKNEGAKKRGPFKRISY